MSLAPALSSLPINSACFCRGQGQTPILSIEGESIATRTMLPLAWRGNQPNRVSVRALGNALFVPVSSTIARTQDTRICGRTCLTPPPSHLAPDLRTAAPDEAVVT